MVRLEQRYRDFRIKTSTLTPSTEFCLKEVVSRVVVAAKASSSSPLSPSRTVSLVSTPRLRISPCHRSIIYAVYCSFSLCMDWVLICYCKLAT